MTANCIDVRLERKQIVPDAYHNALHPQNKPTEKREPDIVDTLKKPKKKSRDMER
ncbi:MAG TPA: hypothetical protein PKW41_14080 [Clostridia bacterium]|nr:hypothetical protein [Clostridia bacterium]HPK17120.1 hypothetical protein [Clostridia bacterium]